MWRDGKGRLILIPWQMEGWFGHFVCGLFLECSSGPKSGIKWALIQHYSGLRLINICLFIVQHSDLVF